MLIVIAWCIKTEDFGMECKILQPAGGPSASDSDKQVTKYITQNSRIEEAAALTYYFHIATMRTLRKKSESGVLVATISQIMDTTHAL